MSKFVVIPDSSCDLSAELRERFNIPDYLHGMIYYPDGREEYSDLDWKEMSPEEYYNSMKGKKVLYKTATPKGEEVFEVFEKYLKEGIDVLSISLSTGLSGTYDICKGAADELLKKYPDRKIICIDSLRYSTALSLIVIEACKKRDEGLSIEETAKYIEEYKHTIHQMGPMDDLFFLVKTGRISNFKAFFGSLVGVNPMADFNEKGLAEVVAKFKGKKDAFAATIEYLKKTVVNPEEQIIFIAHSNREEPAKLLANMVKEAVNPKEIIINPVGMSCGASIGPGLCAVFYHGNAISKDMEFEKSTMAKIEEDIKNKK